MKYLILAIIMSIKTLASDELSERYYYKMEYVDDNTFRFEIKEKDCKKLSNADFDPYILVRECKEKKEPTIERRQKPGGEPYFRKRNP